MSADTRLAAAGVRDGRASAIWLLRTVDRAAGVYPALGLLLGLAVWEAAARIFHPIALPPFTAVLRRLIRLIADGTIAGDLATSLQNLAIGFAIALVLGIAVGILMGWFPLVEEALEPYIYALLTAPTIVFAPIYFSIFGLSHWAIIALIVQYSTLVITINTAAGVKGVPAEMVEMAQVFGASRRHLLLGVVLPAAAPLMMAGVRVGMARAVLGMINGELLIALVGLGATSEGFARAYDTEGVLAMVLIVVIVALICNGLVRAVDGRINHWLPSSQRK